MEEFLIFLDENGLGLGVVGIFEDDQVSFLANRGKIGNAANGNGDVPGGVGDSPGGVPEAEVGTTGHIFHDTEVEVLRVKRWHGDSGAGLQSVIVDVALIPFGLRFGELRGELLVVLAEDAGVGGEIDHEHFDAIDLDGVGTGTGATGADFDAELGRGFGGVTGAAKSLVH